MTISILSLFPEMVSSFFSKSIIKRAIEKKLVTINLVDIRNFAKDKHRSVDDKPYGGGEGMILRIDVLVAALESILKLKKTGRTKIVLLSPQGKLFGNSLAKEFSRLEHLILICGRYEGVDARIKNFIDAEISIGDYILSGGEVAAMVIVDSTARQVKGVLSKKESLENESLERGSLKYEQYTKPFNFKGYKVPQVLLSGNHQQIKSFRYENAKEITLKKRPDLIRS